ncbi:hypothetical protein FSP39_012102 [Pinctada imbricata]|uniref:Uncharacterized protein n=1 Tax=Pinctada imbricata TaxID=66713 RepID=A0AA89C9X0_PINIB|nr:hypothetical protein FSP39_012102 [Pinctada imbricata]
MKMEDIDLKRKVKFSKNTKASGGRHLPRLIEKNGTCNIIPRTIKGKNKQFIRDIFTTLLDTPWRLILPMFAISVVLSWLLFGGLYFAVSKVHGDFDSVVDADDREVCVENTDDFITMVLFSMETQTTIGYGYRYVTPECPLSMILVVLQSIWGALLQALLTGLVIAKVQKPKKRSNTILFSKNVCICSDGNEKYLYIRVGDLQKSDMIDMNAYAVCVRDKVTEDGEYISHFRHHLDLTSTQNARRVSLRWPVVLQHKIDMTSPLWDMDEIEVKSSDFELLVFMEGLIESTGMTVQARTSYLPHEFQWQFMFKPMYVTKAKDGHYEFDLKQFNETVHVPFRLSSTSKRGAKRARYASSSSPEDSNGESGIADSLDTGSISSDVSCDSLQFRKSSYQKYPDIS